MQLTPETPPHPSLAVAHCLSVFDEAIVPDIGSGNE
jgi:hypothetical protein